MLRSAMKSQCSRFSTEKLNFKFELNQKSQNLSGAWAEQELGHELGQEIGLELGQEIGHEPGKKLTQEALQRESSQ